MGKVARKHTRLTRISQNRITTRMRSIQPSKQTRLTRISQTRNRTIKPIDYKHGIVNPTRIHPSKAMINPTRIHPSKAIIRTNPVKVQAGQMRWKTGKNWKTVRAIQSLQKTHGINIEITMKKKIRTHPSKVTIRAHPSNTSLTGNQIHKILLRRIQPVQTHGIDRRILFRTNRAHTGLTHISQNRAHTGLARISQTHRGLAQLV